MKPIYQYAVSVQGLVEESCGFCGAVMVRGVTIKGKSAWFDAECDDSGGHLNHFGTCPERKARKRYFKRRTA